MKKTLFLIALAFMAVVTASAKDEIVVTNAAEFINALGPNRTIVINSKTPINLTSELEERLSSIPLYDYYERNIDPNKTGVGWYDNCDGAALAATGLDNLTIKSRNGAKLMASPRYANVLLFDNCNNLTLDNIVMGHTEDGTCEAGVLELRNCKNVKIDGCDLYGCGTEAMIIIKCMYVDVTNTEMHHCTYHTMHVRKSAHVRFKDCNMHDNRQFEQINVEESHDVWFEDCKFVNLTGMPLLNLGSWTRFYGCVFQGCLDREYDKSVMLPSLAKSNKTWDRWVQITGKGVNLRMAPSINAGRRGDTMIKGEYAPLLDETAEWVKIYLPHRFYGSAWVSKQYAPEVSPSVVPQYVKRRCAHDLLFAHEGEWEADDPDIIIGTEIHGKRQLTICGMHGYEQDYGIILNLTEQDGQPDTYNFNGLDNFNGDYTPYEGTLRLEEMKDGRIKVTIDLDPYDGQRDLPKQIILRHLTPAEVAARNAETARKAAMWELIETLSGTWECCEDKSVSILLSPDVQDDSYNRIYIGDKQYDDNHVITRYTDYDLPINDKYDFSFNVETACSCETNSTARFHFSYDSDNGILTMELVSMDLSHEGAGCMFYLYNDRKKWTFIKTEL